MPPLSVHISNSDPSTAFHDQFSTIIRLESRLYGDYSEDVKGRARRRWVVNHVTDVARAQGFTSSPPAQATTLNVHAREFITPPPAQATTASRPVHSTPWYENFNLADQGVYDSPSPYHPTELIDESYTSRPLTPYTAFDPTELAQYRAVIREQLVQSSSQRAENQRSAFGGNLDYSSDSLPQASQNVTRSRLPTTPPNNFPRVRYPYTPPNRPHRRLHLASPTESLSDLVADTTLRSVRASTEPLAEARMGSLTAPDHYQPLEIYALEVEVGDYIQSVKNPGM